MLKKLTEPSLFAAAVGLLLAATSAWAHHSFAAEYDQNKPVTLRGTLTKVELTNPHGWVYMDVKGPDAKVVNWAIETGPTNALIRHGIRKTDFMPGSEIVVEGFLAKNGTPTINGRDIKFADGRKFFMGSSGTGAPGDGAPSR
jgi:Family of unknown function (DUF6152)